MSNPFNLTYYDRHSGEQKTEHVFAAGFLYWSYNTRLGRALTRWILAQPLVSKCCGWLARRTWSTRLILPFARHMNTDLCCVPVRPEAFSCFNDFFVREYARPFGADVAPPSTCVSPSEGKLLILRNLNPQKSFRVKRSTFHLEDLLASRQLSAQFVGGTAVLCRLGLSDYHHFHFPVAGIPHPARAIKGKLYAGGPYGMRWPTSFYADNYRMVTLIDSDLFGPVAQIEIGAFTVGSIRQQYTPGQHVRRGDKKGYFELGGSTIVLIFAAGTIVIDADLCQYGEQEIETRVRIGDTLGCTPSSRLAITGGLQGAAT